MVVHQVAQVRGHMEGMMEVAGVGGHRQVVQAEGGMVVVVGDNRRGVRIVTGLDQVVGGVVEVMGVAGSNKGKAVTRVVGV